MISKEECQNRLRTEVAKRTGKKDMVEGSPEEILEEAYVMQEVLDENPDWGYKMIIVGDSILITVRQ
jgi:hypothetical protein